MIAGSATSGQRERIFHNRSHAALVNIAHGEYLDSGFANVFLFKNYRHRECR